MIPRFRRSRKPPDVSIDELNRRYGMVMEQAQLFEKVVRGHGRRHEFVKLREMGSSAKVLRDLERIDGMTIGAVQRKYKLPEDEEAIVTFARKLRNELTHDFFASIDKDSTEGRLKAAGRLLAYSRMFHAASQAICELGAALDRPTSP
jgi:hypothetical protein